MRWWSRLGWTLVLTPVLFWLVTAYLASTNGTAADELWGTLAPQLASLFETFTLPALVLCLVLLGSDAVLHAIGADLTTVAVSPLVAWALARFAVPLIPVPLLTQADATTTQAIFIAYGLVWALTIREPKRTLRPDQPAGATA